MKYFLIPCAVLALILTASLWNAAYIEQDVLRWCAGMDTVDRYAQDGDWDSALSVFEQSYDEWSRRQPYLHIVVEHREMDEAEALFTSARRFAQEGETAEFRAELARLRSHLLFLCEMEQFAIENVL